MSKKDRERFQKTGTVFRGGKLVPAVEPQTPKEFNSQELIIQYRCNNCNSVVPKDQLKKHEETCPPKDGHYASFKEIALRRDMAIRCNACNALMPLYHFEDHIKECSKKPPIPKK